MNETTFETGLVVKQENGQITSNIVQLKAFVVKKVEEYQLTSYSEDDATKIKQMKDDRASLNKMSKAIDKVRIEEKKKYLRVFDSFEEEAKGLTSLISEQAAVLDEIIKTAENAAKEKKREQIKAYYDSISVIVPADFKDALYEKVYDTRWENATGTQKAYKEALMKAVQDYVCGLQEIEATGSDYKAEGIEVLKETLSKEKAIEKINALEEKKKEILEKERIRMEQEAEETAQRAIEKEKQRLKEEAAEQKRQEELEAEKANAFIDDYFNSLDSVSKPNNVTESSALTQAATVATIPAQALPGCVCVTFNEFSWGTVKEFCDENNIGYIVN